MVLFSFDIEEFDMPFEYGKTIEFAEQIAISVTGTKRILALLEKHNIAATFFCTATFALAAPDLIKEIVNRGHELASHGFFHSKFTKEDLLASRLKLEEITQSTVSGFRMPRMMPVDEEAIADAGYRYNSSINPTWLPGRYNNLKRPRTIFYEKNVLQFPASVSPLLRIPLFWLSFHNFPLWYYKHLCFKTYQKDGYLNIYFHPWEFTDLHDKQKFGFPGYVSRNSGDAMVARMDLFMSTIKKAGLPTGTISGFLADKI